MHTSHAAIAAFSLMAYGPVTLQAKIPPAPQPWNAFVRDSGTDITVTLGSSKPQKPAAKGGIKPSGGGDKAGAKNAPAQAASKPASGGGGAPKPPGPPPPPPPPRYQYDWDDACPGSAPGSNNTALCASAVSACAASTSTSGGGPRIIIYRREIYPNVTGWSELTRSCNPDAVPANDIAPAAGTAPAPGAPPAPPAPPPPPPRPVLTMGMILDAFHHTQFTVPKTVVQPKGNATLVRLPVYLQATFPAAGYQPDEIAQIPPAQMLGYDVKIKPVLQSVSYDFGDGTTLGPTTDLGGPYPTGTITHPYTRAGTFQQRTTITYSGEASVNGGPYVPLAGTTTLTSPAEAITVRTATNQLTR